MIRASFLTPLLVCAFGASLVGAAPALAQSTGKVKIHVVPKQAYVFVDGKAIRDGSQTIALPAGRHRIGVYNYGYIADVKTVGVVAGKTARLNVALMKSNGTVSGPFGDIELKGHPRAAVLLNGNTPSYFVGHVDEFDNNWIWHQWLLVHPGTYQVTVTRKGQTIWSGPVAVKAGERVIVYLKNGHTVTKDFKRGLSLGPQPRFDAGVASAMVPIAPVTATLSASQSATTCGQPATLNWSAANSVDTSITNVGSVPASGDRAVSPKRTTTYELVAKGPGGTVDRNVTIQVNSQPAATLALSEPEVRYHKIGDKVVEQGSATLNWSTSDADHVTIEPLGVVADSGSRNIEATPGQSGSTGPISRDVTYTLSATNPCGGATTRTAVLHIVGSIDPAPAITLASLFYPTDYPEPRHPRVGLVSSQKRTLERVADTFKNNQQYAQGNQLLLVGHADVRGPRSYNKALSKRRAEAAKAFLISQGIAASEIEVRAEGKTQQISEAQVRQLQSRDPQKPPKWMARRKKDTWLAYNRRVDVILEPAGRKPTEAYPNDALDTRLLWERPVPSLKAVERDSQTVAQATARAQTRRSDK